MIAARSLRGPPPSGCIFIVISRRAFREWNAVERRDERPGVTVPRGGPSHHAILIGFSIAIEQRLAPDSLRSPRVRPASFLRPAQAFLGGRTRHPVGRPDRDGPCFDLFFAEKASLTHRQSRQGDRERQQVEKLPVFLLKIAACVR